jgi:nucleotidyltransferase substrate binding protein (TIGR01987 family)
MGFSRFQCWRRRRFNSSLNLAWKTAEDYLEAEGIELFLLNPRDALKQSCAAGVIKSDETWINMVKLRRALSHAHERNVIDKAAAMICDNYLPALNELHHFFSSHLSGEQ